MITKDIKTSALIEYRRWLEKTIDNHEIQNELIELKENEEEIIDSFYKHLHFGTSGIRGILGAGTNRINEYVVRRATQGLSNYLNKSYKNPSVVISYDSRKMSYEFAQETAKVLSGNGIKAYIFPHITPVSLLSYATRDLKCTMGIMITASHNPKIFNGYKVYNSEGYQIVGREPDLILEEINKLDFFEGIKEDTSLIEVLDDGIEQKFIDTISSFSLLQNEPEILADLSVVYTPLNGAGNKFVRSVFEKVGIHNVTVVGEQEMPDENFTTCPYPNPEKIAAFHEGAKVMSREGADIVIATDPDSDRVGAMIRNGEMNVLMTGNQLGILMLDYLCVKKPPKKGQFIMKSIVSTPFVQNMAEKYGLAVNNTLTGFKYIGEKITELTNENKTDDYYFGFEESNGFLVNPFIRDKDGVSGALIIAEMAAWNKAQGKNLITRLEELYEEFGTCRDKTENIIFEGIQGSIQMNKIMEYFRQNFHEGDKIGNCRVTTHKDYNKDTGLPKSNVLEYGFEDGTIFLIRPSGTEPKMKVYFFESDEADSIRKEVINIIESFKI